MTGLIIGAQMVGAVACFAAAACWPYASAGRAVGGILGSFFLLLAATTAIATAYGVPIHG